MKGMIGKTFAGFLFLIISLRALLLLPAGTINYPRAWLYLLTFAVSVILITVYLFKNDPKLLERRLKAGPAAEKEKNQKVIQALANVFFCLVFIISGFDYRFRWSFVPVSLSIGADVLVGLGFFMVFRVFKENTYTSGIVEIEQGQKVISTGPYGIVRHPMYSGALLLMLFSPIALGSYWAVFCIIPLLVTIVMRLLEEEKFLSNNLPGYLEYCKRVPYRLIPLIW